MYLILRILLGYPRALILGLLLPVLGGLGALPYLEKDIRADAFLDKDNPALLYKNLVKEQFGLSDPLVVLLVSAEDQGVFRPETLSLIETLTDGIAELEHVHGSKLTSLATEQNIVGTEEGMDVSPFLPPDSAAMVDAKHVQIAVNSFPVLLGKLVSSNGRAAAIIVELADDREAEAAYWEIRTYLANFQLPDEIEVHVAGEGAIAGYLGSYVDADAQKLIPLTALIINIVIVIAFRRLSPALVVSMIMMSTLALTLGLMIANSTPFYVITNALPVILIGIAVADSIHVYSHYYGLRAQNPNDPALELALSTVKAMLRPVTITSLTTIAGFMGLYLAAFMPPFQYFGIYAALGVFIAWLYSLFFIPAVIVLSDPKPAESIFSGKAAVIQAGGHSTARTMANFVIDKSAAIVLTYFILSIAGIAAAMQLETDEDPIKIFHKNERIYQADLAINEHMDGSNTLDIVVETPFPEGMLEIENLRWVEGLQNFAVTLPHVQGSLSIVDYLKQMNRAMNANQESFYALPESAQLVAQYLLLYSATGDATSLEDQLDFEYQAANVRLFLNSGAYADIGPVVIALQEYIDSSATPEDIKASLSGRVNLNYNWIKDLRSSHFEGLLIALLLVGTVAVLMFRSFPAGLLALLPVLASILTVYAGMAALGIDLGMGTSMFAAVAIGLGIDFSIHTIDRIRALLPIYGTQMYELLAELYSTTGRALMYNFLAVALGFGLLVVSKIVSLNNFGIIVVLAVFCSFVTSMTLLPALIDIFKPRFIFTRFGNAHTLHVNFPLLFVFALILYPASVVAGQEIERADTIVSNINAMPEGIQVSRHLEMRTTDHRGRSRVKTAIVYRKYFDAEKRTILFFQEPANIKGTAFLISNQLDSSDGDRQWLYLPAHGKVRRISAADRGDYFFGTDFTYEDMKLDGKLEPDDYHFTLLGEQEISGKATYKLSATPKNEVLAKELGYSKFQFWVDRSNWMMLKVEFWDLTGEMLKTLTVPEIDLVDEVWTRKKLVMENNKTGHRTDFNFTKVDYKSPLKDSLFSKRSLERGR